jgi:hypothetical protein
MQVLNCGIDRTAGRAERRRALGRRRAMGIIVQFPEGQRPLGGGRYVDANSEPASVIILPVVRIERQPDQPSDGVDGGSGTASGRRRRRRSSRS